MEQPLKTETYTVTFKLGNGTLLKRHYFTRKEALQILKDGWTEQLGLPLSLESFDPKEADLIRIDGRFEILSEEGKALLWERWEKQIEMANDIIGSACCGRGMI